MSRDRTVGDTFYMRFTTRAFATGIPTALASGVISAYEDANLTQITAGITLTASYDGVAGLNSLTIVATGANGFEAGKDYDLVITTGTVGGVSVVGEVIGSFSLSLSAASKQLAAGVSLSTSQGAITFTSLTCTGKFTISNGLVINRSDSNTAAIVLTGNGTGAGLFAQGGTTGAGLQVVGGATSGSGLLATATAGSDEITADVIAGTLSNVTTVATTTTNTDTAATLILIQGATFSTSTDSLEAIRNRGDTAWTTGAGGSVSIPTTLQNTTIATLTSQTSFTLTAGSTDDTAYANMMVIVEDGTTSEQKAVGIVSTYTGSTKRIVLRDDPGAFTMAVGDTIDIIAISPDILDILADTNELQADDVPTLIAALPTAVENRAEMDNNSTKLATIATDTTTDIPALINALNDISAGDILTTALTEAYAADGAAFTLSEALYMLSAYLMERSTTGTVTTVNKLDGTTPAGTFTLDSATTPTSVTRAS